MLAETMGRPGYCSALIIVDMQNDFVPLDGGFAEMRCSGTCLLLEDCADQPTFRTL
jgi:nicotinamidase-related amidase